MVFSNSQTEDCDSLANTHERNNVAFADDNNLENLMGHDGGVDQFDQKQNVNDLKLQKDHIYIDSSNPTQTKTTPKFEEYKKN